MCGCPLEVEFPCSLKHSRQFCRQLKKSCVKHYCWEKLRRAEVDQEKLNLVRNLPHLKIPFSCVLRLFFLLSSFSGSSSSHHFSLSFSHLSISVCPFLFSISGLRPLTISLCPFLISVSPALRPLTISLCPFLISVSPARRRQRAGQIAAMAG